MAKHHCVDYSGGHDYPDGDDVVDFYSWLKTGGALLLAARLLAPFLSFPNLFQLVFNLLKFFFLHGQQSGDDGIEAFGWIG